MSGRLKKYVNNRILTYANKSLIDFKPIALDNQVYEHFIKNYV